MNRTWQPGIRIFVAIMLFSAFGPLLHAWQDDTRTFDMGFTPWPYDATEEAVDHTYQRLHQYGNLVAHHLGGGIPWQEALDGQPYSNQLLAEIEGRTSKTRLPVYLAIEALNSERDGLANYWGESENKPLEAPWQSRSWNDPEVIEAFIRFSLDMIDHFNPKYFNYGVEVSDLIRHNPQGFEKFKVFAAEVYPRIKAVHPNLELLVSVALQSPCSEDGRAIAERMSDLMPFVDMVGVSVYGYAFFDHEGRGDPKTLPPDWLTQINGFSAGKPIAITETGWIAEDLTIPTFGLSVPASEQNQQDYVSRLLSTADQFELAFVVWFAAGDYDALWSGALNQDPTAAIWRDTGLFDETGEPRPGLTTWADWFAKPRHRFLIPHLATGWENVLFVDHPGPEPLDFEIEWFDEVGNVSGSQQFSATGFQKIDLTDTFPEAHAARLTTSSDESRFRLAYAEPTEKGVAEFTLTEARYSRLQFNFPLFSSDQVPLTWKGLALYHDGGLTTAVQLKAFDAQGQLLAETEVSLLPRQRIRATLSSLFGIENAQMLSVVRVTAQSTDGQLAGLNISGNGLSRLLFTQATEEN